MLLLPLALWLAVAAASWGDALGPAGAPEVLATREADVAAAREVGVRARLVSANDTRLAGHLLALVVDHVERSCLPVRRHVRIVHPPPGAVLPRWLRDELGLVDAALAAWLRARHPLHADASAVHAAAGRSLLDAALASRPTLFAHATGLSVQLAPNDTVVWVKGAPHGQFEGADDASTYPDNAAALARMPAAVRAHIAHEDVVITRPLHRSLTLGGFLDTRGHAPGDPPGLEWYLQYYPALAARVAPHMPRVLDRLTLESTNVWLGGRTVGRLHFDQYDNVNCVARGVKTFTLVAPHHSAHVYENHLRQGHLHLAGGQLLRALEEATAMVFSPVVPTQPDLARYPLYAHARPFNVTVPAGHCLLLPAFWWHEVYTQPDAHGWALSVNQWYHPVWIKDFPCARCPLRLNVARYRELLQQLAAGEATRAEL